MPRAVVAAVVALWPTLACAGGVGLVYERGVGAEACADEATLRAAVAAELHANPFGEPTEWTVTATLNGSRSGMHARIVLRDAAGRPVGARELSGRDCDELVPAVAWVIALAVGPLLHDVASSAPARAAPPGLTKATGPSGPPPATSPIALQRPVPRRRRWSWRVAAGALVSLDGSPAPAALGFTLGAALARRRYVFGIELRGDLPSGAAARYGGRIATSRLFGTLVPCVTRRVAALCALAAFGVERGSGQGYAQPTAAAAPFIALGGRLAFEWPLAPMLALQVHADVLAALTHLELYVGSARTAEDRVYRTPDISSALGISFVAHYP